MEKGGNNGQPERLVAKKRREAYEAICDQLDARLTGKIGKTFEAGGRSYELTCAEDCMVAYAQQMRQEIEALHNEVITKNDYYEEKATAKLLALFQTYERLVSLYAELRSYYPEAADRVSSHIPSLTDCAKHGEELWDEAQQK